MDNPANDFSKLSAEDECSAYAKMTPEEHQDMQAWLDEVQAKNDLAESAKLIQFVSDNALNQD